MSKQTERENFLLTMQAEGVPAEVARLVLRHAASLHRLAELECSSEAYDRDRVKCPGGRRQEWQTGDGRKFTTEADALAHASRVHKRMGNFIAVVNTTTAIGCVCRDFGAFEDHARHVATCGTCGRSWCDYCDPAQGPLCHWCHGRGRSTHPVKPGTVPRCSHGTIPRGAVRQELLQARVVKLLEPFNVEPVFSGDPRGAVVKLRVPSGRTDDWGQTGVCVP